MRNTVFFCTFLSFFVSASLFSDEVDHVLLNRLRTEGVAGLRAQEGFLRSIHLVFERAVEDRRFEYDYYASSDNFLLKMEIPADMREAMPEHGEYRQGKNNNYFFEISKKKSESQWKLDECSDLNSFAPENYSVADIFDVFPCYISMTPLSEVLEHPGFEITHIEYVTDQSEETVSLDFEINADGVVKGNESLRTGNIQLLPTRNWAIKEMTLNSNRGGKTFVTTFNFAYGVDNKEPYQVEHVESRLFFNPDDLSKFTSWNYVVRKVDDAKVPKKELYLKYYGIDEPKIAGSHIGWVRYALVIVGVLAILAGTVRIVCRRRHESGDANTES